MSEREKLGYDRWKGTSLNLFTRQQYRCSKCLHKDWWNYIMRTLVDLTHFHNIQIFEELARYLFPGMQIN